MKNKILSFDEILSLILPLKIKYDIKEIYLFGSYARNMAREESDLDLLVSGGENFKSVDIFAFGEELRRLTNKSVDAFEICELNTNSEFYNAAMKERVLIA